VAQGFWLRRRTPRLPDAGGPLEGKITGAGEPIKLIAVGESTVAGVGASVHETALVGQLALALSQRSKRSVSWLVAARSGINARKSVTELVPKLSGLSADVVLIALGVNDSIEFHTARRWADDLEVLITAIRAEVGEALVLLAGVPPLDCFPVLPQPLNFVLGARSAALGKASAAVASKMKRVLHVPFQIEKRDARHLFCADGFHPSELGYRLWAEQLAEAFARSESDLLAAGFSD
jgi:lysophospholipase L1-like esterase